VIEGAVVSAVAPTVTVSVAVPPGPLAVSVRLAAKPARITPEPGARPVPFTYRDGVVRLTVPGVVIHDIVALTP
jgi:hypothetical protein